MKSKGLLQNIISFYIEGFKNMTWGKTLWLLILVKLFLIFFIMKFFFFSDNFENKLKNEKEKSEYFLDQLTQ